MQRLKTRAQFQAVLAGINVARTQHFALHAVALESRIEWRTSPDTWIGAMVPKRWAKRAVTRNAIKRQIYNVTNLAREGLPPVALVVRLRSQFDKTMYISAQSDALKNAVRLELGTLIAKAQFAALVSLAAPA